MAFVKDDYNVLVVNFVIFILLNECCKLLNRSDDNVSIGVLQLLFKNGSRGITVSCTFFKTVIFFHCLVVQVLTVNYKEYLINVREQ